MQQASMDMELMEDMGKDMVMATGKVMVMVTDMAMDTMMMKRLQKKLNKLSVKINET